jgi:hypothetical protein
MDMFAIFFFLKTIMDVWRPIDGKFCRTVGYCSMLEQCFSNFYTEFPILNYLEVGLSQKVAMGYCSSVMYRDDCFMRPE